MLNKIDLQILVTNAFRQCGFPREKASKLNQLFRLSESPMPFGNAGFPEPLNGDKVSMLLSKSPMPFGNAGFPELEGNE